jgi:DnaJ-domain-containing protein 1
MSTMPVNTLEQRLEALLSASPDGMSEHALIRNLAKEGRSPFAEGSLRDELQLFRMHFELFHRLYLLRDRLRQEGRAELLISPLKIVMGPFVPGAPGLAKEDPLRAYYLDRQNLNIARSEVRRLLQGFHRRLAVSGERAEALALLGLEEPADYSAIKRRYRELAMRHHPDRGGDTGTLQRLNRAMAVLERGQR